MVFIRIVKSQMHIPNRCVSWKFASGAENSVLPALQFHKMLICRKFPGGGSTPNESFVEGQFKVSA
jgi:hypothetical protein